MENTIESIWKEGFLNEKAIIVPKINDLYNQRSKHLVDRIRRMFRVNLLIIIAMSVLMPVFLYFVDALWQGITASFLLLCLAWYSNRQIKSVKSVHQGTNSYEYLTAYRRWLRDMILKNEKIMRFFYPVNFLIAISIILSAWNNQEELQLKLINRFPNLTYIDGIPLIVLIILGIVMLMIILFSGKIYRWDLGIVYGRIFDKLDETISEMEKLKSE